MILDIEAALVDEAPAATGRCKVGRWLDSIDSQSPGFSRLVAAVEVADSRTPGYMTGDRAMRLLRRLDFDVSNKVFYDHRSGTRCRCAD